MKNQNRIKGGRIAKAQGQAFEHELLAHARRQGFVDIAIPTGCRQVGANKTILVKTPFDFVFISKAFTLYCDAKTINQKSFPCSLIKHHQLDALCRIEGIMSADIYAGYVIYFRPANTVRFFTSSELLAIRDGESLKHDQGLNLGSIEMINLNNIKPQELFF